MTTPYVQLPPEPPEHKGGASIRISADPMFRTAVRWFWGVLGIGFVSCVGLAANNLYQLNLTVARAADTSMVMNAQLVDHEARLRQVEKDISEVQGKVFRGVDGYEEPKRGR